MQLVWTMIWKEWLGLRWKLAALAAIPLGALASLFIYDATYIAPALMVIVVGYGAVAPPFLAMHAAAEERSSGTLEFVRGLPVPLYQLGLVRVLATLTVLLVPLVVTGFLTYGVASFMSWWNTALYFETGIPNVGLVSTIAGVIGLSMVVTASLFLWTTALAMNQPSELRAGLVGIATLAIWGAWTMFSVAQWDNGPANWTWLYGITALGPFATLIMFDPHLTAAARIAVGLSHIIVACLLVIIAANRYGALERRRWTASAAFSRPNRALWWLQWREVWPLGAAGLAAVLLIGVTLVAGQSRAADLNEITTFLGGAWAIIIGATIFSADLEPRLVAFWQSRPIDPSGWFRTKYVTGALAVVAGIDLPAALLGVARDASSTGHFLACLACVPALHLAIYSVAVAISCLVRHVIYAGILSMAVTLFMVVLPMIVPKRGLLSAINIEAVMYPPAETNLPPHLLALSIYLAFALLVTIVATAVAHWAVQKDVAIRA